MVVFISSLKISRYGVSDPHRNSDVDRLKSNLDNLLKKIEERRLARLNVEQRISETVYGENVSELVREVPLESAKKKKRKRADSERSIYGKENDKFSSGFTIIDNQLFNYGHEKIKRKLPHWLSHPTIVSTDLKNLTVNVEGLDYLHNALKHNLAKSKITHLFPVQSDVIPEILKNHWDIRSLWPRDICVSAPTGSGKTLVYVLAIVQVLLKKRTWDHIGALVVLPTKDLAIQVYNVFRKMTAGTFLKVEKLVGNSGKLETEKKRIVAKDEEWGFVSLADIVVATPGRLVEHMKYTEGFSLEKLKFLVIDEADHVMEYSQNNWLYYLHKHLRPVFPGNSIPPLTLKMVTSNPFRPQRLVFSATLSQDPEKLRTLALFQPRLYTSSPCKNGEKMDVENEENSAVECTEFIGKYATPKELKEYYTVCTLTTKPLVLYKLIAKNKWKQIMCFVDSASNVHRLSLLLQHLSKNAEGENSKPLRVAEISSKVELERHKNILSDFARGKIDVLVTTDSLARGIDLWNVKCVILYDAPKFVKNYIHRIGRTGRAGHEGTSLALITPDEQAQFDAILKKAKKTDVVAKIEVMVSELKPLELIYKEALQNLRDEVQDEKQYKIKEWRKSQTGLGSLKWKKHFEKKKKPANRAGSVKFGMRSKKLKKCAKEKEETPCLKL